MHSHGTTHTHTGRALVTADLLRASSEWLGTPTMMQVPAGKNGGMGGSGREGCGHTSPLLMSRGADRMKGRSWARLFWGVELAANNSLPPFFPPSST